LATIGLVTLVVLTAYGVSIGTVHPLLGALAVGSFGVIVLMRRRFDPIKPEELPPEQPKEPSP
jgi:hypothetical protein